MLFWAPFLHNLCLIIVTRIIILCKRKSLENNNADVTGILFVRAPDLFHQTKYGHSLVKVRMSHLGMWQTTKTATMLRIILARFISPWPPLPPPHNANLNK